LYCFLVLAASGFAARAWFRNHYAPLASTIAALVYISFPYIVGQTIYDRVSIGELTTFLWMPLILALCDRIYPPRLWVIGAIGVAFALLILSNVLTAALFFPVMLLYAIVSGKHEGASYLDCIAFVLGSVALGIGVAATYIFPLLASHRFLNADAVPANHPYAELGRQLLFITSSEVAAYRIALAGIALSLCLALVVAWVVWRSKVSVAGRLGLLATLGMGTAMLIPDLGPKFTQLGHLRVSGFDSYNGFCVRMLFTALFTLGLGFLAYCRLAAEGTNSRQRLLLIVSCCSFFMMLPWSVVIWKAIPELGSIIQFPWRFCAILSVLVAGLFAAAIDDCVRHGFRGTRKPSFFLLVLVAIVVVGAGNIIWGANTRFRDRTTPSIDMTRGVDPMYPTYVPPKNVANFARDVGTSPDAWYIAPSPVVYGVRADITGGQGNVSVTRIGPRELLVSLGSNSDVRAQIGQVYFPFWRIVPATQSSSDVVLGSSPDGLIEVSSGPGHHDFRLVFDVGWPERCGDIVSLLSILVAMIAFVFAALSVKRRAKIVNEEHVWT
jgi:hypothetical protein